MLDSDKRGDTALVILIKLSNTNRQQTDTPYQLAHH